MSVANESPELTQSPETISQAVEQYVTVELARRKAGEPFREQAREAEKKAVKEALLSLGITSNEFDFIERVAADDLAANGGTLTRDGYRFESREKVAYVHKQDGQTFSWNEIESHKEREA